MKTVNKHSRLSAPASLRFALNHAQQGNLAAKISLILALAMCIAVISSPKWLVAFYEKPHQETVETYAGKYNIDPYMVFAIIKAESNGQSNACSDAGAMGLMQLMPDTAEWIAGQMGKNDFETSDLSDPEVNIDMGCWYIKELAEEFSGKDAAVIAAYNAGHTKVREWLDDGTWDGSRDHLDQIPYRETRDYVKRVIRNYQIYCTLYE